MSGSAVSAVGIGREGQPLVTIDGFAADPDGLREAACATRFTPAEHHYPGIRALLPTAYLDRQLPMLDPLIRNVFGLYGPISVVDASFSMVTTPPSALSIQQTVPHADAFDVERIALVHYLSTDSDGTAFFRHRATDFETISHERAPIYFDRLATEMKDEAVRPMGYIRDHSPLFERTMLAPAAYNRAILYRSFMLHSGAIRPDASLSDDPADGRLTVTAFLAVARR